MTLPFSASHRRAVATLAGILLLAAVPAAWSQPAAPMVELSAMRQALEQKSAVVIDIREPDEHAAGVAEGARLLPMSQLKRRLDEIPRDRPVLLVCGTQGRSANVVASLRERGYTQVQYVKGGMSGWTQKGWPVVKPAAEAAPAR